MVFIFQFPNILALLKMMERDSVVFLNLSLIQESGGESEQERGIYEEITQKEQKVRMNRSTWNQSLDNSDPHKNNTENKKG